MKDVRQVSLEGQISLQKMEFERLNNELQKTRFILKMSIGLNFNIFPQRKMEFDEWESSCSRATDCNIVFRKD